MFSSVIVFFALSLSLGVSDRQDGPQELPLGEDRQDICCGSHVSPRKEGGVLSSGNCDCPLFGNRVLADVTRLR